MMGSHYDITHYKNKDNYVFWDYEFLKLDEDEIPVISAEEGNSMIDDIHRILENTTEDDETLVICDSLGSSVRDTVITELIDALNKYHSK